MFVGTDARKRRSGQWALLAVVGIGAATWYLWPSAVNGSTDVAALGSSEFAAGSDELEFHIRVRGRGFEWLGEAGSWCDVARLLGDGPLDDSVGVLAVGVDTIGNCTGDPVGTSRDLLAEQGIDLLAVALPGNATEVPVDVETVNTVTLIGVNGILTMPCEAWDECAPGEVITVRSPAGELTSDASERIARMVAAAIA